MPEVTPISMAGASDFRFNVSVPRAGEPPYAFPVDTSLTRADNSVYPRSVGSGRDQPPQGARVDAPPVAAGSLFGQLGYAGAIASTSMFTCHVNPIDVAVQGPRFAAIPSQLINAPFALPSVSTVRQAATSPILGAPPPSSVMQSVASPPQVLVPTSGVSAPASVSPIGGLGAAVANHPTTTVSSISAAVSTGYSVSMVGVSVPSGSVLTSVSSVYQSPSVPSVPSVLSVPSIPAVPSVPLVPSTVSIPSVYLNPSLNGGMPQVIYRSVGPGANNVTVGGSDPSQAVSGNYVPNLVGYTGPCMWSAGGPVPVGPIGAYGWPSGVPPPAGQQVATGWVTGLPEQARGTASATANQNPTTDSATAPSTVNLATGVSGSPAPQSDTIANAVGSYTSLSVGTVSVNGWPVNAPPSVDPLGTAGWLMGLPEQARGMAHATVTGVAGPMVVSPQPPDLISQQSVSTVPVPMLGTGAANSVLLVVPGSDAGKPKNLLKLLPYSGEESLETFLAKFDYMARYLNWKEADKFYHLCTSLDGPAGQVLWGLKPDATTDSVIALLGTRFGNELQIEGFRAELRARRCKPGEKLQALYLDITRMVALAHPTSVPDLTQHVAKEAFVSALGDDALQVRVMEKQPNTIEEALGIAGRLEAYENTLKAQATLPSGGEPPQTETRVLCRCLLYTSPSPRD